MAVCMLFAYLENRSSDLVHTWEVWILRAQASAALNLMHSLAQKYKALSPQNTLEINQ